jgi:hypothetical protein
MIAVPIPADLSHLAELGTRPINVGSAEVQRLLEFWGVTRNGHSMLKKLLEAGTLTQVPTCGLRKRIYATDKVLALYHQLLAA